MSKLTKPARIGATIFEIGVDEQTVIERAQREYGRGQCGLESDGLKCTYPECSCSLPTLRYVRPSAPTDQVRDIASVAWNARRRADFNAGLETAARECERCAVYSTAGAYYAKLLRGLIEGTGMPVRADGSVAPMGE